MLRNFSLIVSILYTISLSLLSLIKLKDIVQDLPSLNDKVCHAFAHFIFVILWFLVFYFKFNFKYNKAIGLAAFSSLVYGVSIELLQGWITVSSQSEFNDVFANVLGMMFASLFLLSIKKGMLKKNNSLLF